MLKDDVVTFIAHLNVTIKHLTRYKQKVVLATMLEGKSMPTNSTRGLLSISEFIYERLELNLHQDEKGKGNSLKF